jgi:3-oxoacyl-[acyl-carrier protein] reductase
MMVALITGGSRGLGRELAIRLCNEGYRVVVNYYKFRDNVGEQPSNSIAIRADVGDAEAVKKMRDIIKEEYGRLDVIINNAGITRDGLLINYDEKDWDEVIRVNLKGCFNVLRYLTPLVIDSGGGDIINIGSRSGIMGKAGQAAYSASKAAVTGMTYSLAKELAPYNIRVNCIIPGYMATDMGRKSPKAMENAKRESVLKRLSETGDVATFTMAILKSRSVTGQVFSIDSRL